jgi:cysteinyl-tRNA synthetase
MSRIDEAVDKRNKGDFCLWKFSKPGEPSWPTTLGEGRPGWHIEDTAISEFYFGPQYEIHGGGVDLKFPHHEAEIAQQESASGLVPFVKLWMHTGALLVDGKKMSKSLGNFILIRDFLKNNSPEVLRWITLTHHYRSPIDFSEESISQAKAAIETLRGFLARIAFLIQNEKNLPEQEARKDSLATFDEDFLKDLSDDLNTPAAIGRIFAVISDLNPHIWKLDPKVAHVIQAHIRKNLGILGFAFPTSEIPQKIQEKAKQRELSRASKQFEQSDALRKEINALGYEVEDTPNGPFVWSKS